MRGRTEPFFFTDLVDRNKPNWPKPAVVSGQSPYVVFYVARPGLVRFAQWSPQAFRLEQSQTHEPLTTHRSPLTITKGPSHGPDHDIRRLDDARVPAGRLGLGEDRPARGARPG